MSNINWKLRAQNKVTLITLGTTVITLLYQILALLGITPSISQSDAIDTVIVVIELLAVLGIIVDPTTSGIGDTAQAMTYTEPRKE